jgi:hypothetical protein
MPLLFSVDPAKKHDVIFDFDPKERRWYVDIRPADSKRKK